MPKNNLVIKQQKSRLWYVTTGFSLLFLFVGAFLVGRYLALADLNTTKANLKVSQQQLTVTRNELDNANQSLVMQKQASQVDNLSNQELVSSVKSMQETQKALEEELVFYRKIMAPEKEKEGLAIDSIELSPTGNLGEYHYRATLIQAGKQTQFLKGSLDLKLNGLLEGQSKEFNFRELGTFKAKQFQFQFKYFQNLEGIIKLPDGFVAQKVKATARTTGRRKNQRVETEINWQL